MANEVFTIDSMHPQASAVDCAAHALASGGLALIPTDTTYCVCSLARSGVEESGGIGRLMGFKDHATGPSFPWLVSSADDLDVYGRSVSDAARLLAERFWPGGLSLVVKASAAVPRVLTRKDGTISLRLSASPVVSGILRALDRPLVSTGANVHGAPPPLAYGELDPAIIAAVDVALDGGACCVGRSTIVDCTQEPAIILRDGIVSREDIDDVLGYQTPLV